YECVGNSDGIPVVFLHGGPGSGCSETSKTFFDPKKWFAVFFDQRGCGLSKPAGETEENNTQLLLNDIEDLRLKLKIQRWVVFGGSWGSTLAIMYAISYPKNVSALVLRGIFFASSREIDWFLFELRRFMPREWNSFTADIDFEENDSSSIINYYYDQVFSPNREEAVKYAKKWRNWEEAAMRLTYTQRDKKEVPNTNPGENNRILASMKVHLHYLKNKCFLEPGELLKNLSCLNEMPTYIVQGQIDTICPPETSELLYMKLPNSFITRVHGAGHGAYETAIKEALLVALENVEKEIKK
ncbi:MAG: prolyl aminopeptidase, partial [Betaproteobacteria bacterium TMED156]